MLVPSRSSAYSCALACFGLLIALSGCAADPPPGWTPAAGASAAGAPAYGGAGAAAVGGSGVSGSSSGSPGSAAAGSSAAPIPSAPDGSPVGRHGALRVSGNRIVDASGAPVQLRGMSLFWTQWSSFYAPHTIDQLADDWRVTVVRAALGVENAGGFLERPADNEAKVVRVVDRAIERGIYVIIDWHDHHAENHQAAAIDFFTRMAKKYGGTPAVIFEIYNEPLKIGWPVVKTYAEALIGAIRAAGAKNLVIVGTPNWSQDVDAAAASPITSDPDVAYTLHFYAATHKQWLRTKAETALTAGLPLFVTEWGTCEANGNGALDQAETKTWLDFMQQHQIGWANWSLNDKAEACSALAPNAGTTGPWMGSALTASGMLIKAAIP